MLHFVLDRFKPLFVLSVEKRIELLKEAFRADQVRRPAEEARVAGYIAVSPDPATFQVLSAALSSYEAAQTQEAAKVTQEHDDPDEGDSARQTAIAADRPHLQAVEAADCAHH